MHNEQPRLSDNDLNTHCFVVMSRDRPHMLRQALSSLVVSPVTPINICVSDNSSSSELSLEAESVAKSFNCSFRSSSDVSISRHYHEIFSGLKYDFITILHDDDLVIPGFVESVLSEIQLDNYFSVLGFNALMFQTVNASSNSYKLTRCSPAPTCLSRSNLVLSKPFDVLFQWVGPFCTGIVPFSGLTFNASLYDRSFFDFYSKGNLFFDTLLVLIFSEMAPIKWNTQSTLVMIRVHDLRLTECADFSDSKSFANAVLSRYFSDWRVFVLMYYFLSTRKLSHAYISGSKMTLLIFLRYFLSLVLCSLVWPVNFVRHLIRKLSSLLTSF